MLIMVIPCLGKSNFVAPKAGAWSTISGFQPMGGPEGPVLPYWSLYFIEYLTIIILIKSRIDSSSRVYMCMKALKTELLPHRSTTVQIHITLVQIRLHISWTTHDLAIFCQFAL